MKTKYVLKAAALMLVSFLFFGTAAKAQTTINIQYAGDSTWGTMCPPPQNVAFMVYGQTTGYTVGTDSVDVCVNFGDGDDDTIRVDITTGGWYYAYVNHTYLSSGIFSCVYTATAVLDANTATQTTLNELVIGVSCGNINGKLYHDLDGNCSYSSSADSVLRGYPMVLMLGTSILAYSYTDVNGDYFFSAPNGNYTVELGNISNTGFLPSCPASGIIAVNPSTNPTNDMGLTCNNTFDFVADVWGTRFTPGQFGYVYPSVINASCMPTSGTITLTLDPLTTFSSSTITPTSVVGNVVTWNFTNISNNNYWYWWNSLWNQVTIITSTSAQIGDTVCFSVVVTPTVGDANPANNTDNYCIDVRTSWDPNMKEVSPRGIGATGDVAPNTNFTYTLHFQNLGNAQAYNINILDTIDADLDLSTMSVLASSHAVSPEYQGNNVMKFNFPNINLPDSASNPLGSKGWVTYTIRTKPGLLNGTQIHNTGYIYFDFNPAVVTNTTLNTISTFLSAEELASVTGVDLYPNPAVESFFINTGSMTNATIEVLDLTGRVLISLQAENDKTEISVKELPAGLYQVIMKDESAIYSGKIQVVK